MRASIIVKYCPATNTKGARWVARSSNGAGKKVTVGFDYGGTKYHGAVEAAALLAKQLEWRGNWVMGELDTSAYVFVVHQGLAPKDVAFIIDNYGIAANYGEI